MTEETKSHSEKYWHDKYFSLLGELEEQTQTSSDKYELLRRGLVMTTLLAEGQTLSLDRQLKQLRGTLKPGGDGLDNSLSALRKAIDEFESESDIHFEVLLGLITDTAHKLRKCPLPAPLLSKIRNTSQHATSELEHWIGYRNQLQAWLEIIGELSDADDEETPKSIWWQSLFGHTQTPEQSAKADQSNEPKINMKAELSDLIQSVSTTVHSLLEKLIIPEHLVSAKLNILERLEQQLEWGELAPVLNDTANFLFQCIAASQLKIEDFLQSLDLRLQDIRSLVSEADGDSNKRFKSRDELDVLIREQLSNVHTVISDDSDLSNLSTNVPKHLELILRALENNRDIEDKRERQFKAHILQLQKRLNGMEQELGKSQQTLNERNSKATLDPLTGLPKREAFQQRIVVELARSKHLGSPLSLVCCDIDSFKRINESFGYLSGNKTLQLIAKLLRKNIRDTDFIVRFGGQKFIILMPDTNAQKAVVVAEKLRHVVQSSPFSFRQERVLITMSLGVAELIANENANSAFERAEQALLDAKEEGRNKTVLAS